MELLHLDSVIESTDKYNGKKVSDLMKGKKGTIFQMIKKGYQFDDEVLSASNITKTIRDERFELVVVEHEKDNRKPKKQELPPKELVIELDDITLPTQTDYYAGDYED